MSSDSGDKTEEATPKKREEAHNDGKVAKSQEVTSAVLLLGLTFVLTTLLPRMAESLMRLMDTSLMRITEPGLDSKAIISLAQTAGWKVLWVIMPVAAAMACISFGINAIQAKGVLSLKPLETKLERISPLNNFKRVFGKQALFELLKSLLKVSIVGIALYVTVDVSTIDRILVTSQLAPAGFLNTVMGSVTTLLRAASIAYLFVAGADFMWQRFQFSKQLRMSKQDVKQEIRNSDGDPLLKQRMRSMARSIARRQMLKDVPKADVIIVNPTHRAIALEYDPIKAPAPTVLAMGERKIAEKIKAIAMENGVPVIENRALAIALITSARVGMMIPAELYIAVAEVLAFVIQERQRSLWKRQYR